MPFAQAPRVHDEVDWLIALGAKQTAYGTAALDATLLDRVRGVGFSPAEIARALQPDVNLVGREWSTTRRELSRDTRLARTFECSTELAGFFAGFALGKVTTAAGPPVSHVFRFLHPLTEGQQPPVFSAYEQLYHVVGVQRKFRDLAVASLTIRGRAREILSIQANMVGSGYHAPLDVAIPASDLVQHYLHGGSTTVLYGARTAGADITPRVIEWEITISPELDEANGYTPASGLYRSRIWQGVTRAVSANLVAWCDIGNTDLYDDWLADAVRELKITVTGATIGAGPATHSLEIFFPGFRPSAAVIGEQDGKMVYRLSIARDDIVVDGVSAPDEPIQITVINETPAYLQAPA